MTKLSLIIGEIYSKYLPLAEKASIRLDLDIADPTEETGEDENLKAELDKQLKAALKRTPNGEIKIAADKNKIVIQDSGTTLSPTACTLLSRGRVSAKSRVGFGTTVKIDLEPKSSPKSKKPLPF